MRPLKSVLMNVTVPKFLEAVISMNPMLYVC